MALKNLISKVEEVGKELEKLERFYRSEGDKAYEIDDQAVFQEIQLNTYNKVKKIKDWKDRIAGLNVSILKEYGELPEPQEVAQEPVLKEIEPQIQEEEPQIQEAEPKREELEEPEEPTSEEEEIPMAITLIMFNETYPLKYWSAVLVKVCQVVLVKQPFVIARLSQEKSVKNPEEAYFSYLKGDIKHQPRRLHNGLWIELDRTGDDVLEVVDTIKELGGYTDNDIAIEYE